MFKELKEYFNKGLTRSYDFRILALEKLENSILYYYDELVEAFSSDYNKREFDVVTTEVGLVLEEIRYYKANLAKFMNPKRVHTSLTSFPSKGYIVSEPYGVVFIASPWNYPFNLTMIPLVGAIAAGNVIFLKMSDKTPKIKEVTKKILSVFPSEYIYVCGNTKEERETLFDLPYDYIFYTGSNKVATILMEKQAKYLTPMSLELGGKSPCIIDEESDLEVAAKRVAWGKFLNAGQTCVAPDYVLVHESVKEKFNEYLIKYIKEFYYENDKLKDNFVNVISKEHVDKLLSLMDEGHILCGGKAKGLKLEPTVIDGVDFDFKIMKDEIFGPLLPIITYNNLDEILDRLTNLDKPLACYYFTTKKNKAKKVMERLSFGGGCLNDTIMHVSERNLPFGGVGKSGMGSYHGKKSFDTFTHYKSILVKNPKKELSFRYPSNKDKLKFIKTFFKIKTRGH